MDEADRNKEQLNEATRNAAYGYQAAKARMIENQYASHLQNPQNRMMVDMAAQMPSQMSGSGTTIASLHGTNYQDAVLNSRDFKLEQTMNDMDLTQ